MKFFARNFDPAAERAAKAAAIREEARTGRRHVVEYRDHYNDYSVAGDYVVRPA